MAKQESAGQPRLLELGPRKALVLVEEDGNASNRLALTINGEPVAPVRTIVRRDGVPNGVNLIADAVSHDAPPWRPVADAAIEASRVRDGKWGLPGGATVALRAASGVKGAAEYVTPDGRVTIRLGAAADYIFEGYFARHRCDASVQIELFSTRGGKLTTLSKIIPKASGGSTLDGYAHVVLKFNAPAECSARLCISIDRNDANGANAADAYLFLTHLALASSGGEVLRWNAEALSADTLATLNDAAAVVELTLPCAASPGAATLEIVDRASGDTIGETQLTLPLDAPLAFTLSAFDGVTLSGRVSGAEADDRLELAIDSIVVATTGPGRLGSEQDVRLRVPDAFLDGAPHIVELRDARTGKSLYLNALTLRHLTTPWETLVEFSRTPYPAELHPQARRRYENLAAHTKALVASPEASAHFVAAAEAHTLLSAEPRRPVADWRLRAPACPRPDVSILVCAADMASLTRSVAGLLLAFNRTSYEIVAVTQDAAENVDAFAQHIEGVRVVTAEATATRARMLNTAADAARGTYLAIIDDSAEPTARWLDELRGAFTLFGDVGIACARAVSPNGRLVAAGGLVEAGRAPQPIVGTGNPHHPGVAHSRAVDYAPLHAAMLPRDLWMQAGGLSEVFAARALEDADLALKLARDGKRAVCIATAEVALHRQPVSAVSPQDLATFRRKWPAASCRTGAAGSTAPDRNVFGRVLVIDHRTPRGDQDAGSYAALQEMRLFQALGFKVTFMPLDLAHGGTYTRALQRAGVEVIHAPFATSVDDFVAQRGEVFDAVYITRYQVARAVLPSVRRWCARAKVIFNAADLHFLRELRAGLVQRDATMLRRGGVTRDAELAIAREVDLTLSYSDVEQAVILSHNLDKARVATAPWVIEPVTHDTSFAERRDVAFIGSFGHAPNLEAVRFFTRDVMPQLRAVNPDIRFVIYGSQMGADVMALERDGVVVAGYVDDVASVYAAARVMVAPLLSGAGVKGKVLEAMAHGVPCVLSRIAAEGLGAAAGTHFLGAETAREWADAILSLHTDEARWNTMATEAQALVVRNHSRAKGIAQMRRALEAVDIFPPEAAENSLAYLTALPPLD